MQVTKGVCICCEWSRLATHRKGQVGALTHSQRASATGDCLHPACVFAVKCFLTHKYGHSRKGLMETRETSHYHCR